MALVYRAYVPTVEFTQSQSFVQQGIAAVTAPLCRNVVTPGLPHRKVWAWLWSTSAGPWSINVDLVALRGGTEVYRQKLIYWGTAAGDQIFISGIIQVTTLVGALNEQVFTNIGGVTYGAAPWRMNITCDTFQLDPVSVTDSGSGALFNASIMVQSQQGI